MRRLGPLEAVEAVQNPDAPWVVMFHGYGADAFDLASLADVIPAKKPLNYLFPQGPLEVPIGPGWTGRAWWPINMTPFFAPYLVTASISKSGVAWV